MPLTRRTLKDGSKFWDYIDWIDLRDRMIDIAVALVTSGPLYDILVEVVVTDETGNFYVRGDVDQDGFDYDNEKFITTSDALDIYKFGLNIYEDINDTTYNNIINYILYSEDLQKYYGAPSSWTATGAAAAVFYDADTGDTVPELVISDKAQTLTNKTIDSLNNAITINLGDSDLNFSGTIEEFNSALSDGTFVTTDDISTFVSVADINAILPLTFKYGTVVDANLDRDNTFNVTFDTPFVNNLYGIQIQIKRVTGTGIMYAYSTYIIEDSTTGFTFRISSDQSVSSGSGSIYWFAYGD